MLKLDEMENDIDVEVKETVVDEEWAKFQELFNEHQRNEEIKARQKDIDLAAAALNKNDNLIVDSAIGTEKFRKLRSRVRQWQGNESDDYSPDDDDQPHLNQYLQPDLMYPSDFQEFQESNNLLDRSIGSPTGLRTALIENPATNTSISELERSLERRVQYEIEAEHRPRAKRNLHDSYKRKRNVFEERAEDIEQYLSDEEEVWPPPTLIYDRMQTPPQFDGPITVPGLLDKSFNNEELTDALINAPEPAEELNEDDMQYEDMFGDDAMATPSELDRVEDPDNLENEEQIPFTDLAPSTPRRQLIIPDIQIQSATPPSERARSPQITAEHQQNANLLKVLKRGFKAPKTPVVVPPAIEQGMHIYFFTHLCNTSVECKSPTNIPYSTRGSTNSS